MIGSYRFIEERATNILLVDVSEQCKHCFFIEHDNVYINLYKVASIGVFRNICSVVSFPPKRIAMLRSLCEKVTVYPFL